MASDCAAEHRDNDLGFRFRQVHLCLFGKAYFRLWRDVRLRMVVFIVV
jgi:hypothetical protein